MKKIIYILVICFLPVCCKKESYDSNIYQAIIKENFTSPYKQIENIQVGDYIPYSIAIKDNEMIDSNTEYRLSPIKEGQAYHQKLWIDFGLYLNEEDNVIHSKGKGYISFTKKGTHSFYIKPLVPGTFKHSYNFQKFVKGNPVGDIIKLNVSFNAVEIIFTKDNQGKALRINEGEDSTDTYLSAEGITSSSFVGRVITKDEEQHLIQDNIFGDFDCKKLNHFKTFKDREIVKWEKITIKQNIGELSFIIEYYNRKY